MFPHHPAGRGQNSLVAQRVAGALLVPKARKLFPIRDKFLQVRGLGKCAHDEVNVIRHEAVRKN